MATTVEQLKALQKQVRRLQIESAEMQRVLRARGMLPATKRMRMGRNALATARVVSDGHRAVQVLQRAGRLVELDSELKRQAAEWRALPEERKRQVTELLESLRLDPPLSRIIHA